MKKLFLLFALSCAMSCEPVLTMAQCPTPSNLSAKGGDIIFTPTANTSVYEISIGGSIVPVSTPTSIDKQGNYHYSYSGSTANWYSLPKSGLAKVRSFCISEYWYLYPKESNWQHYKSDPTKFSQWSPTITIK